jgi:hypothetical protein
MISVVCVYNDEGVLRASLLSSLRKQDAEYELILVDNTKGVFQSLPKALNYGGSEAKGHYLMFVHQDVELIGSGWLKRAERMLSSIDDLGAAGVAGVDFNGSRVGFIIDRGRFWGSPIKEPKPVMTLDEQLIIVPRKVFNAMKFYEGFRWHSWAADLCLRIWSSGLKAYVLPLPVSHNSSTLPIREAGRVEDDDLKLWIRHGRLYPVIHKTTGTITSAILQASRKRGTIPSFMRPLISLVKSARPCHRAVYGEYKTMLDVVVPSEQPSMKEAKARGSYSVGTSDKVQYLLASKRINVHDDYVYASMERPPFKRGAFDIAIVRGRLEYLSKHEGEDLLSALEEISRRVVVMVPNKGLPLSSKLRYYRSIWSVDELRDKGYKVYGVGLVTKLRIRGLLRKPLDYVANLMLWRLPRVARILVAVKKCTL